MGLQSFSAVVPTPQPSEEGLPTSASPGKVHGVSRGAPAVLTREEDVGSCLALQRSPLRPPCRRARRCVNQGDVSSSLQPAVLLRLQWDWPAAQGWQGVLSIPHPSAAQPSLPGHFILCSHTVLFHGAPSTLMSADRKRFPSTSYPSNLIKRLIASID